MLSRTGYGHSPLMMSEKNIMKFDLSSSLPAGMVYTRVDTVATYRNSNGLLVRASSDVPRFDHEASGQPLGLLIEAPAQNKNTNWNINPVALSGLTKGGDAASVLSLVSDSAALESGGLGNLCSNGNVYKLDNSAGTAAAYADIAGAAGNTNKHSGSVYARGQTANTVGSLSLSGTGAGSVNITGTGYVRYKLENQTPSSSAVTLRVRANAGKIVYFILNQFEEGEFCTSPIVVAGSAASRATETLSLSLAGKDYFGGDEGFMTIRYRPLAVHSTLYQYLLVADNGSSANTLGIRINPASGALCSYVRAGGAAISSVANTDTHLAYQLAVAAISWKEGSSTIYSGGLSDTRAWASSPAGLNKLNIGGRSAGLDPFNGHILSLVIGRAARVAEDLAPYMYQASDILVAGGGQSLVAGYFDSFEAGDDAGRRKLVQYLAQSFPHQVVVFVDGAYGGSAAQRTSDPLTYWWDTATATRGNALEAFYRKVGAAGIHPNILLFELGETDSGAIKNGLTTGSQYKAAMEAIFSNIRRHYGSLPVILQKIGRRMTFEYSGAVQEVREIQNELMNDVEYIHAGAETYDQTLYDDVHPTDAGYLVMAERNARMIARVRGNSGAGAGAEGPKMQSAIRNSLNVTIQLAHDGGTDITPAGAGAIKGFHFFAGNTEIGISAATRSGAAEITLTLGALPQGGSERVIYIYDEETVLSMAGIVYDNAIKPMPLRSSSVVL